MKKIRILGAYTNFKEKTVNGKVEYYYSGVDLYRTVNPLKYLDPKKYDVEFAFDLFSKYKTVDELTKHYDILFCSYIHDPRLYIELKVCGLRNGMKILMDIDDDIWSVDRLHPHYEDFKEGSENMFNRSAILIDVDKIVTTNSFLRYRIIEKIKRDHKDVYVVPNYIDLTLFDYKKIPPAKKKKEIVIGWMGGSSHFKDINKPEFTKALGQIMFKYPNVRFKTTGYYPQLRALFGYKYQYELARYSVLRYIDEIWTKMSGECDIFVAPLSRSTYSRAKSYVKLLEYGAGKKPVVAEKITPYEEFCDGEDKGVYLADNSDDWFNYLEKLILSDKLRKENGEKLYNEVVKNHTIQKNTKKYEEILDNLCKKE